MDVRSANRSRTRPPDRTNLGEIVRATVDKHSACGCGQALDTCHARCCPRCGVPVVAKRPAGLVPRHSPSWAEWSA